MTFTDSTLSIGLLHPFGFYFRLVLRCLCVFNLAAIIMRWDLYTFHSCTNLKHHTKFTWNQTINYSQNRHNTTSKLFYSKTLKRAAIVGIWKNIRRSTTMMKYEIKLQLNFTSDIPTENNYWLSFSDLWIVAITCDNKTIAFFCIFSLR